MPLLFPARSGNTRFRQGFGNVRSCLAHHEGAVNVADNLGLSFDHLGQSILTLLKAEELLVAKADLAIRKTLALAPGHVVRNGAAFFLRDAGHNGDQQFAFAIQRVDALFLKVDRNAAFLQLANGGQGVDRVSGKTGYRLRKDQIDLAIERIPDHPVEALTLFRVGTRDPLVRIDLNKRPVRTLGDLPGIVVHLGFITALLFFVLS